MFLAPLAAAVSPRHHGSRFLLKRTLKEKKCFISSRFFPFFLSLSYERLEDLGAGAALLLLLLEAALLLAALLLEPLLLETAVGFFRL